MMTRRASRRTVDYSQFNADSDNHESDDDFKDSSFPPPSKKTKTTIEVKKGTKQGQQGVMKKQVRQPGEDQAKQSRKSRDEKQFEKELQQALEISKSNSKGAPQSDDDNESLQSKGHGISKEKIEAGEKLQQPLGRHESNGKVDGNEENDEDFHPSSCEDDDDDDNEDEDDFCIDSESDEEFHSSKTKKQKTPMSDKCPAQKRKSKSNDSNARNAPKSKSSKKCSERSGTATTKLPVKNSPLLSSHLNTKGGVKNSNKSAPATPTSTLGKSSYHPKPSPGLKANSSSGLGGVVVTSGRPGGLRLGLSRNVRIAKPLHSNINIK